MEHIGLFMAVLILLRRMRTELTQRTVKIGILYGSKSVNL